MLKASVEQREPTDSSVTRGPYSEMGGVAIWPRIWRMLLRGNFVI